MLTIRRAGVGASRITRALSHAEGTGALSSGAGAMRCT
jgi:hypothetical protein